MDILCIWSVWHVNTHLVQTSNMVQNGTNCPNGVQYALSGMQWTEYYTILHLVHSANGAVDVNTTMLRKAVDVGAPCTLTTCGLIYAHKKDVFVAPCYERLWFCTPRCHQLWAILWPHFGPCYERQMHNMYINRSMLRKAVDVGATKYWAILWPHLGCANGLSGKS